MVQLPAGMRNNNPGNIKYIGQPGTTASLNTDQGDPQAVYATPEAGMAAMYQLLMRKYTGGKLTPASIIAGQGGWTPGNMQAAQNIANTMGIGVNDDIGMTDSARAGRFMRALMRQEHGEASNQYTDAQINAAVNTPYTAATPGTSYETTTPNRYDPLTGVLTKGATTTRARHPQNPQVGTGGYIAPGAPGAPAPTADPLNAAIVSKLTGLETNPWTGLASGLASSVKPSSGLDNGGFDSELPALPTFESALPAEGMAAAAPVGDLATGQLADLFKVGEFGQAAQLNVDQFGRPIRQRS